VFRVLGGDITAQFVTGPGGALKLIALTGSSGTYRNIGGDGPWSSSATARAG